MRIGSSDALLEQGMHVDAASRKVSITYKCGSFSDDESPEFVQDLVDGAVERLLTKTRRALGDKGPIRIYVEHYQKERGNGAPLGGLRYLKVYVEGQGPCIVMAY